MSDQLILVERRAGYRVITFNRPDRLNAFNEAMHHALRAAIEEAEADESLPRADDHRRRPRLLRRAGPHRPAGQAGRGAGGAQHPRTILQSAGAQTARAALPRGRGAVNGVAAGAGCNIALACDIVLAARSASFIQSFARIGLIPDSGGTWFLPRLVGDARARGLALLAQELPAEKAADWGLIWRCVDDNALIYEARRVCEHFADRADARPGADQARARCLGRQRPQRPARSRARPATRSEPDARLCRGRARLHGKAQSQFHRPQVTE